MTQGTGAQKAMVPVRMERNFVLDEAEAAAGFVLTCQAQATTAQVMLSFDER